MTGKTIGERIKQLRNRNGLTQNELASHMSVGNSTISNWESDRRLPSINELNRMARVFNVSLDVFSDNPPIDGTYKHPDFQPETRTIRVKAPLLRLSPIDDTMTSAGALLLLAAFILNGVMHHFLFYFATMVFLGSFLEGRHDRKSDQNKNMISVVVGDNEHVALVRVNRTQVALTRIRLMLIMSVAPLVMMMIVVGLIGYAALSSSDPIMTLPWILSVTICVFPVLLRHRTMVATLKEIHKPFGSTDMFVRITNQITATILIIIVSMFAMYVLMLIGSAGVGNADRWVASFIVLALACEYGLYRALRVLQSSYEIGIIKSGARIVSLTDQTKGADL
jgi:transcriptional regulator with XRE-family HTH domain